MKSMFNHPVMLYYYETKNNSTQIRSKAIVCLEDVQDIVDSPNFEDHPTLTHPMMQVLETALMGNLRYCDDTIQTKTKKLQKELDAAAENLYNEIRKVEKDE